MCRLRCTAGQILAVFQESCRSAFARRLLHFIKHALKHAYLGRYQTSLRTKMGYAAVQCVELRMDNYWEMAQIISGGF